MVEAIDHLKLKNQFEVVGGFVRSWANQDIDGCLAYVTPDIRYSDNIGDDGAPYKGIWQGKDELRRKMVMVSRHWMNLVVAPQQFRPRLEDPTLIQCRTEFVLLHKRSGEFLFGKSRLVTKIEDGLISDIRVYYDAPMFRAFVNLIARQANGQQRTVGQRADSEACC